MTTATIALTDICSGGNHLTFTVSGAWSQSKVIELDKLSDGLTEDEKIGFISVIVKMAKQGRTMAQARTLLQSGVTVVV